MTTPIAPENPTSTETTKTSAETTSKPWAAYFEKYTYEEAKSQLLERHQKELGELELHYLKENMVVTIQANHLSHHPDGPYTLEIVFPHDLPPEEKHRVNNELDKMLKNDLAALGYKLQWKEPKSWG
jgi:hypothetical protein